MIKNAVDVCLGKEAVNVDRSKFESFDDTLLQLMHHNETSRKLLTNSIIVKVRKRILQECFKDVRLQSRNPII